MNLKSCNISWPRQAFFNHSVVEHVIAFVTNNATAAAKNATSTAGCGCSIDARWAQGRSALHGGSKYWQAFIGPPILPNALKYEDAQDWSFNDPRIQKFLSPPITADNDWIQALNTGYQLRDSTGNYTALEFILISTRLWELSWVLNDGVNPIRELE
jgi:hypothetical protein